MQDREIAASRVFLYERFSFLTMFLKGKGTCAAIVVLKTVTWRDARDRFTYSFHYFDMKSLLLQSFFAYSFLVLKIT